MLNATRNTPSVSSFAPVQECLWQIYRNGCAESYSVLIYHFNRYYQIGIQSGFINSRSLSSLHSHCSASFLAVTFIFADERQMGPHSCFWTMFLNRKWFWPSQHNWATYIDSACLSNHILHIRVIMHFEGRRSKLFETGRTWKIQDACLHTYSSFG